MRGVAAGWLAAALLVVWVPAAQGQAGVDLKAVGWQQQVGERLPGDLAFVDRHGRSLDLASVLHDGPVIIAPVYYRCPKLCSVALAGLARVSGAVAGEKARVLAFSFDAGEGPEDAARAADDLARRHPGAGVDGWYFTTAEAATVTRAARALGFSFRRDADTGDFAHPAGFAVLTPGGEISRYFFGIDYGESELAGALARAADHGLGAPLSRLAMLCFDYDPQTGRYTVAVMKTVRLGGILVTLVLAVVVIRAIRRERGGGDRS